MASDITIRRATAADNTTAFRLIDEYCESIGAVVRDDHSASHSGLWVAFAGSEPAGCVVLRSLPSLAESGEVKRLYVRPQYRGHGLAERLMKEVEQFAADSGLKWLYLDTTAEMHAAQRLYARLGFQPCDRYNSNPQATLFMRKALESTLQLREFQPGDEAAFCQLNEAWIEQFFKIEEKDREILRQPKKYILDVGGQIFMAVRGDVPVGCCALIPMPNGSFELSKMGVAEAERGRGVGRQMLNYVIAEAGKRNLQRLYLETNHKLKNAIHLYESVGFVHLAPNQVPPSRYERADVYMELFLTHAAPARD